MRESQTTQLLDLISSKNHTINFILTNNYNLIYYQFPIITIYFSSLLPLVPGLQESSTTPKPTKYCFLHLFTDSPLILIYLLSQIQVYGQSLYLLPYIQPQLSCLSLSLSLCCAWVLKYNNFFKPNPDANIK